eukprot:TRINITY_DN2686_c0_g1_i1.p1 TRINITY_DN2686_c0_g1~~TRINITY_DN2686_c0_g1_i1.p1  ORF type:complete len:164 (-),score=46.96 TRINITY_DN2686_c0_g1_i1:169-660(-)
MMLYRGLSFLLCITLSSCLAVDTTSGRDSKVYPLLFNPLDITHWKCIGVTLYENTEKSALYTYEVDVCFMAVLGAKLSFPWIYEYYTGNNFFSAIGLTSRSGQEYPQPQGQYNQYQDDYYEQETAASTISERASEIFSEMGKAIHRDSRPHYNTNYNKLQNLF